MIEVKTRIAYAYQVATDGALAQIAAEEAESANPGSAYARFLCREAERLNRKGEFLLRAVWDEVLGPEEPDDG